MELQFSSRKMAILAGISLLLMALVAGFSYGFVLTGVHVPDDAAATAANIQSSELLFRFGFFGWLLILLLDVVVAWALYVFFKPAKSSLNLLAAWLRLVYVAILGVALLNFVMLLLLLSGADYLTVLDAAARDAQVLLLLDGFLSIWSVGLVVFGLHLLVLGIVAMRSGSVPRLIAWLLVLAGTAYLVHDSAIILLPNFADYKSTVETILSVPMAVGELAFALWLLFKGGKSAR